MKYLKSVLYMLASFLSLNLFITLFSYFDLFKDKTINILEVIIFIISFMISSIYLGLNSKKKAYFEGLKLSLIYIIIFSIFTLIIPSLDFSIKTIIYYLLIILINIIGCIIGINIKNKKK